MGKFSTKTFFMIAGLVLIWGLCWPIYKLALAYTPPILFSGMRALFGGLMLLVFLIPSWQKMKWRQNWSVYCISALFNTILFFGLQTIGLMYMPGGLFSVLVYAQPVLIGVFGWLLLGERMSVIKVAGLVIGFLGVIAVSAGSLSGKISAIGVILALLTAISWAIGVIYVKRVGHRVDSMWLVCLQCVIGGLVLSALGSAMESWSSIVWNGTYLTGLIYGSVFGVPLAFIMYFKLVNAGEASKVASFTFLVPLIAVLVGTVFLGEPFTYSLLTGLIFIVLSIYFVNYTGKKRKLKLAGEMTCDALE